MEAGISGGFCSGVFIEDGPVRRRSESATPRRLQCFNPLIPKPELRVVKVLFGCQRDSDAAISHAFCYFTMTAFEALPPRLLFTVMFIGLEVTRLNFAV